jgi:hypothetical protein
MRRRYLTKSHGILLDYAPVIADPLFSRLFRLDEIFTNPDATEFSARKIWVTKENGDVVEFFNYSEGLL